MSRNLFEGWYFKHQNKYDTVSLIPGISSSGAFIQVITDNESFNVDFPKQQFHNKSENIVLGKNIFSFKEIILDINTEDLKAKGNISYKNLTPLKNDIMGPFRFFSMECRHAVISMHHKLSGSLEINGKAYDFENGTGYIEKDSGYSFPKRYAWVQSNDFSEKCSIMAAVADIPFFLLHFEGIICAIYYKGKEYRLATYNGAKVIECNSKKIKIANKDLCLEIYVAEYKSHSLLAPKSGKMSNTIKEAPSCNARFKFFQNNTLVFDMESDKSSCEFVGY